MSEKISTPAELISPEAKAFINLSIEQAVKGVFASLGPILKDIAITPEKLREANKPYVDPVVIARAKRERQESQQQEAERLASEEARKKNCKHLDKNGHPSISLSRNFADRQPRGICVLCHAWFWPNEWRIASSEEQAQIEADRNKTKRVGKAWIEREHPLYHIVRQIESMS